MRIPVCPRRAVMALAVCLLVSLRPVPAAARWPRATRRQRAAAAAARSRAAQAKRAAIQAKLKAEEQRIHQKKVELNAKRVDIRNAKHDLHVKKAQVVRLSDEVRELQIRTDEAAKRLKGAVNRLAVAERLVEEVTHRLQKAEERLSRHRGRLSRRIARSYTMGTVTFADVLLQASSLSDFLDREYYVQRIFHDDVDFLTELREEQHEVAQERAELEQKRAELAGARQERQLELQEIQGLKQAREQLLNRVENEKELKEQELQELEQDSNSITAMLEEEWRRRQEFWRQLHHGMNIPMPGWPGNYLRPVPFPIGSGFGMRFHPILGYYRMHTGVDFMAPLGTPIHAVNDGEVVWGSWRGGYGRCIILLHGGGVATLYGHCSEIYVHPGQEVKRGELIGATGSTGLSTGPHLHFEIRVNGVPVDPIARRP